MSDYVIIDGDTAKFEATFGTAIITVAPGKITGSGSKLKISDKAVCVESDESIVKVFECAYLTPTFPTPGSGTLTIDSLVSDQKAQKLTINGKKAILVGSKFNAKFTVIKPATSPAPASDATLEYFGSGVFVTNNTVIKSD